jgi:4-amino-4-deoxy-L-arabinose transferase-like glycosyltransferase
LKSPNPALVTHRAAQQMPRFALLLFCAAYVLPGLFGRDPWKSADITAFGYMVNIAQGHSSWMSPSIGGLDAGPGLLPYWLGAAFIKLLSPLMQPELAARIPFAALLALALALTWYSTYYLARTEAAQPLPFAFGGEASPVDYARAIADGALLAMIATLGLLQLGHETTPELVQLASVTLYLYCLAASPYRSVKPKLGILVALGTMAASDAPNMAIALSLCGALICHFSHLEPARRFTAWVIGGGVLAAAIAFATSAWAWRLQGYGSSREILAVLRMLAWFSWPAWPLALWTLWRWRRHCFQRHISIPLACMLVCLLASLAMGGSDRALMLGVPALAILAAFALPTLDRSTAAAVDWFSVCFFTLCALVIWVIYVAMQTGIPAKPAANVARLAPGFVPSFSLLPLVLAIIGTVAWFWLVQWRAGRNRHPLWKSLVLPASGVALCWLLLMTLWLPLLDFARSYRPLVQRVIPHVPRDACIAAPGIAPSLAAALEHFGPYQVVAGPHTQQSGCDFLLQQDLLESVTAPPAGWTLIAREQRPTRRDESVSIYHRDISVRP